MTTITGNELVAETLKRLGIDTFFILCPRLELRHALFITHHPSPDHSGLMPAALITLDHLAMSALR